MRKVCIEVRRPGGRIETVDVSDRYDGMTDQLFRRIARAMADGGRGEALRYWIEASAPQMSPERRALSRAEHALEDAEHAACYDPVQIIRLRERCDEAERAWRTAQPAEAATADEIAQRESDRRRHEHHDAVARKLEMED